MVRTCIYFVFILFFISSCNQEKDKEFDMIKKTKLLNIEKNDIDILSSKKIYFGHMSVGKNILSGVSRILDKNNFRLNVLSIEDNKDRFFTNGYLLHSNIGRNGDPYSKIRDFELKISNELFKNVDVSFFKFCYVDFKQGTDVEAVFQKYTDTMDFLIQKYPDIIFVHTTVPLRKLQTGIKATIKKLIGKSIGIEDNLARNKFNKLLKEKYQNAAPIFDIALFESTKPNGLREFVKVGNDTCYTLANDYTYDGGHLNLKGEDYIGEQLLVFLSQIFK